MKQQVSHVYVEEFYDQKLSWFSSGFKTIDIRASQEAHEVKFNL